MTLSPSAGFCVSAAPLRTGIGATERTCFARAAAMDRLLRSVNAAVCTAALILLPDKSVSSAIENLAAAALARLPSGRASLPSNPSFASKSSAIQDPPGSMSRLINPFVKGSAALFLTPKSVVRENSFGVVRVISPPNRANLLVLLAPPSVTGAVVRG